MKRPKTSPRKQFPTVPKVVLLLESSRASGRALLTGVARYAHHHGPWSFYWEPAGLEKAWPVLRTLDADGIIMRDVEKVGEVLACGIPAVVVGHSRTEIPGLVNVVTDSASIGRMAADHLIACGFREFGYCAILQSGIERTPWSRQRGESFAGRLREAGFDTHFYIPRQSAASLSWARERQLMARWLQALPKPLGILACNDDRGQQVIEACRAAELHVPDQVAVMGVDNDELICGLSDPPMSSVVIGFERAGYESAESLHLLIRGRQPAQSKILVAASHVVTRRSTNILSVEDPFVARALRFIRDHSRDAISVPQVAQAAALSRRALEKRFRQSLARSVFSEIRRVRVEHISQLLAETTLSIAEVAEQLAFEGPQHIARYFRSEKGMTPREFRLRRARS
jgi:LacI family transcriptional regulator